MKSPAGVLSLVLTLGAASPAHPAESPALARKPEVAAALQVLDAWIQATVAEREQPGLSIGIVHDQDLLWAKGYADLARKTPATPATAYRIASISKLFTSTAILQLRDAGKLRLDDPVAQHLPFFRIRNGHPEGPTITVRHLITHTSGLPRESPLSYWNRAWASPSAGWGSRSASATAAASPATARRSRSHPRTSWRSSSSPTPTTATRSAT